MRNLKQAVDAKVIHQQQADQFIQYAESLYYPDLSYQGILQSDVVLAWPNDVRTQLEQYIKTNTYNLKKQDTISALQFARCLSPDPTICKTHYIPYVHLPGRRQYRLAFTNFAHVGRIGNVEDVLMTIRKTSGRIANMKDDLMRRCFLLDWAKQRGITCPEDNLQQYCHQWTNQRIDRYGPCWMEDNGLTTWLFETLLEEYALAEWITELGPASFGIEWNVEKALAEDLLFSDPWHLSDTPAVGETDKPRRVLSLRCLLVDWADKYGIMYPADRLEAYISRWENNTILRVDLIGLENKN